MNKIISLVMCISILMLGCSCSTEKSNYNNIRQECVTDSNGNEYYIEGGTYYIEGDKFINRSLFKKDADTGEVKMLDKDSDDEEMYLSNIFIFDGKLYYIKRSNKLVDYDKLPTYLYCLDLQSNKITKMLFESEHSRALEGEGVPELIMFEVYGEKYILYEYSIYKVGDILEKKFDGIMSVYVSDEDVYYSDFDGNVKKYNIKNKNVSTVLLAEDAETEGEKIKFGSAVNENWITVKDNTLYYIGSGSGLGRGRIYAYDMLNKGKSEIIVDKAVAKFLIYNDKIVYQYKGDIYLMSINDNDVEKLTTESKVNYFSIINDTIHYIDSDYHKQSIDIPK